jgi:hypothetical protein
MLRRNPSSRNENNKKPPQPINRARQLPIRGVLALLLPPLKPLLEIGLALPVVLTTTQADQLVTSAIVVLLEVVLPFLEILLKNGSALAVATKTSLRRESVPVVPFKEERARLKTQMMAIGIASLVDSRIDQPLNFALDPLVVLPKERKGLSGIALVVLRISVIDPLATKEIAAFLKIPIVQLK